MVSSCQGKGVPCPCSEFKKGKKGKGCHNCGHSKRRHSTITGPTAPCTPPPSTQPRNTVDSILAYHRSKITTGLGLNNLKPMLSRENALKDVLPGYHRGPGHASSSSRSAEGSRTASSSSSRPKKKKQIAKSVKFQQIGSLLFLLCGMWACTDEYGNDQVELRSDKPLPGREEEELHQESIGLLVDQDAAGLPLQFSLHWSTEAIDKWLRGKAPKLFQYLDLTFGIRDGTNDQYHWRLVRQQSKRLFLFGKELVNGSDLLKCVGGQARKKETFRLTFATRHPIDKSIWSNFDRAIRVPQKKPINVDFVDTIERKPAMPDDSEEGSSSEEESDSNIKAAKAEAVQSEDESSSDEEGMYSRSVLVKHQAKQPLFGVSESDGEEQAAQASEVENELNTNGKRPRPTSPVSPRLYNTRLAKRTRLARLHESSPEMEQAQAETPHGQGGVVEGSETAEGSMAVAVAAVAAVAAAAADTGIPTTETALFIDGVDFNVPDSPGDFSYYYSPVPSPPLFPEEEVAGPSSSGLIRDSPGRPSKTAWKKRKTSA
ncbi:hypothetical protein GSI_08355 [Ganoderma sinense ZZ0214-1]|uniref:Uncharacterized protein n=1 Tax=Ganoderma sinense ZZ0214-1 TaxID=1077348 RepID=A0A2G8S740_9APHY|nr:hypothetical protein GSI_08355 [Ganoderma sinense ZZ0214-1]